MASRKEGTTLGPYRILEQVGQGGMATVYKAFQPSMERTIALKILPAYYAQDPRFIERFKREARTIARLEHKNILPVYDFGEESGITYLAMRYLDGGTLKDMLGLGRLSLCDAVEIMIQICAALDYAHRQGVVHRDVKPANIMVDSECSAYLTDFGIAKVLEGVPGLTETGAAVGTPAYMAPEQALGKPVDARTDIYALGIILYEMILGRPPFQADTPMAVALAHIHDPLPLPRQIDPNVPEEIENVILKALAKNPDDRYQTASEMAGALKEASAQAGALSASSTLRSLATQAHEQIASQTLQVSPEMFARAHPTIRPAAAPPHRGVSPVAIGGIAAGVVVVAIIVGVIVLTRPGRAPASAGSSPTSAPTVQEAGVMPTQRGEAPGPTDAPVIEPPQLPGPYDNFDDPAYNGKFNPSLWSEAKDHICAFVQENGTLVVKSPDPGVTRWCNLTVKNPPEATSGDLGIIQARMKTGAKPAGGYGENMVEIVAYRPGGPSLWVARCGITGSKDDTTLMLYVMNLEKADGWKDRYQRNFPAEADHWYTLQITLDPATMMATCTADGKVLGSAVADNALTTADYRFARGMLAWYDVGPDIAVFTDDFSILPVPPE